MGFVISVVLETNNYHDLCFFGLFKVHFSSFNVCFIKIIKKQKILAHFLHIPPLYQIKIYKVLLVHFIFRWQIEVELGGCSYWIKLHTQRHWCNFFLVRRMFSFAQQKYLGGTVENFHVMEKYEMTFPWRMNTLKV